MVFRVTFHDDEVANQRIQKLVGIGVLIGMVASVIIWFSPIADKWHATEPEVDNKVELSMKQHMIEQEAVPYAMKNDITHQGNIRIDEKIFGAQNEIKDIEDEIDNGGLDEIGKAKLNRKIQRLREQITVWNSRYEPEPGAMHSHKQ